jgi:hypothetical protein
MLDSDCSRCDKASIELPSTRAVDPGLVATSRVAKTNFLRVLIGLLAFVPANLVLEPTTTLRLFFKVNSGISVVTDISLVS